MIEDEIFNQLTNINPNHYELANDEHVCLLCGVKTDRMLKLKEHYIKDKDLLSTPNIFICHDCINEIMYKEQEDN